MPNKELKQLYESNNSLLEEAKVKPPRNIRHFIFSGRGPEETYDAISIPLCGEITNPVATRRIANVTCKVCLGLLQQLASTDTYDESLVLVSVTAPKVIQPDEEVMQEKVAGKPTKAALRHTKARQFLEQHGLKSVDDLPRNIIGTSKATFYSNLTELNLVIGPDDIIDDPSLEPQLGEPNADTLASIQEQIDGLPA